MDELIAAFITLWDADATLTAVPTPFDGQSPDDATYPRAAYAVFSGPDAYHFDKTIVSTPTLRVTILHTDRATLGTYSRALENALSKVKLDLGAGGPAHMSTRLTRRDDGVQEQRDLTGNTVYRHTRDFRCEVQRDLP